MEKPSSRIQITIEVDNNGQKEHKELPLKLLVLSNLTGQAQATPVIQRHKLVVSKSNFNQTLAALQPALRLVINSQDQKTDIPVELCFRHISDFRPESIVQQVPHLTKLLAMRNLLKDLKANLIDNQGLRQTLKELGQQPRALQQLQQELNNMTEQDNEPN